MRTNYIFHIPCKSCFFLPVVLLLLCCQQRWHWFYEYKSIGDVTQSAACRSWVFVQIILMVSISLFSSSWTSWNLPHFKSQKSTCLKFTRFESLGVYLASNELNVFCQHLPASDWTTMDDTRAPLKLKPKHCDCPLEVDRSLTHKTYHLPQSSQDSWQTKYQSIWQMLPWWSFALSPSPVALSG